jgi:hypothetical protein
MRHLWKAVPVVLLTLSIAVMAGAVAQAQDSAQSMENKTAIGNLVRVDTDAKTLSIKQENGEQMQFDYDANTKVEGSQTTVQGLASEAGTSVTVTYIEKAGKKLASRIEVKKGEK